MKKEFSQQEKILIAKRKILTTKKEFSQQMRKKSTQKINSHDNKKIITRKQNKYSGCQKQY